MRVHLANPRGFCAGVDRAIAIVERALALFGAPVHVRHEVVHNRSVVARLRARGVRFVEDLAEVPDGAVVIFSAHGVSRAVRNAAALRGLTVFDATCPLVTKVHMEITHYRKLGIECVLIGHASHPEVEGILGQADDGLYLVETLDDVARIALRDPARVAYVTQTTLSPDDTARIVAALRERFPALKGPRKEDICYATQNRQEAVRELARRCPLVLVIGSPNSSNTLRLREVAERTGARAYLLDDASGMKPEWFTDVDDIGLTAGASAPEDLVQELIARLRALGAEVIETPATAIERVVFPVPKALRGGDYGQTF
ncbi:MAG: 4-hydroxy-3-methylbut-2-enyl diphosphate reductase [Acidobacteriaceae bacterium]